MTSFLESILLVICCFPCFIGNVIYERTPAGKVPWEEKQLTKNATPPKPVKRKRTLSLPMTEKRFRQRTYDQEQAAFFKLPMELRVLVYEEYFGNGPFWIKLCSRRLTAARGYSDDWFLGKPMDVLSLLQTCRRIYSEAIPLLYSTPTFRFFSMSSFISFYSAILPARSSVIRSVVINFKHNSNGRGWVLKPREFIDYSYTRSNCRVNNTIPHVPWQQGACFRDITLLLLEKMEGLRHLEMIIDPVLFSGTRRWSSHSELLKYLGPLSRKVHIDVIVLGQIRRVWKWHLGKQEAALWTLDGELVFRQKGNDNPEWWF